MIKVKINWNGPYDLDSSKLESFLGKIGLYTISKKKKDFDDIIYIGISKNLCKRVYEHTDFWLNDEYGKIKIRIGLIKKITYKKLKDVENVLIFVHNPPENTVNKEDYWGQDMHIENTGRSGDLFKEIKLIF